MTTRTRRHRARIIFDQKFHKRPMLAAWTSVQSIRMAFLNTVACQRWCLSCIVLVCSTFEHFPTIWFSLPLEIFGKVILLLFIVFYKTVPKSKISIFQLSALNIWQHLHTSFNVLLYSLVSLPLCASIRGNKAVLKAKAYVLNRKNGWKKR